ncbi:YrrS family protein [Bacillus sp. EB01]|uniref:YrrS family protein n=1 Tax=Bacillus sp. EB01 TaxID=1347086 RepID=UPI0005C50E67|nr:YrrS family protein [Bacillus sp. EB01]
MEQDYTQSTRSRYRAKRKKTNLILNSLIVIVIIAILAVGYSIFAGGNDASPKPQVQPETSASNGTGGSGQKENPAGESSKEDEQEADEEEADEQESENEDAEPVVTEGGSSPNVKRTIENPGWKPVGTEQTGEHKVVIEDSSQDWQEMLDALSYAIETDKNSMTVWWLQQDKNNEGGAIGTVSAKGSDQAYRVYIQWVDGQGYKPVKVEELIENDKKS